MQNLTFPRLFFFFLLSTNVLIAQKYVNAVCKLNNGQNLSGLLKNNFRTDDEFIIFKESDQEKKINIKDIAELLIDDEDLYISKIIYFHPNTLLNASELIDSKVTDLELRTSKHVLLKTLVKGDINLYQTFINDRILYFFSKRDEVALEYLENYNYKYNDDKIIMNVQFRRALLKYVNCNNHITNSYQYIDYNEKDLTKVVNAHNICVNGSSAILNKVTDKKLRLSAFGGIKSSEGTIKGEFISRNAFTHNNIGPNFGAEFSYVVNRNSTSEILTRLDYSTLDFIGSAVTDTYLGATTYEEIIEFESSVISFLLGYRYQLRSLSDVRKSNFGIDFGLNVSFPLNSNFSYRRRLVGATQFTDVDLSGFVSDVVLGMSIGTSYTYLKRYTFEIRYTSNVNYIDKLQGFDAKFSYFNLGFKYLILE